jgi:hypothetical protein
LFHHRRGERAVRSFLIAVLISILFVGSADAGWLRDLIGPNDDQRCQGYGFRPGTSDYAHCRMTLDLKRQQDHTDAVRGMGDSLERAGAGFQNKPPPDDYVQHTVWARKRNNHLPLSTSLATLGSAQVTRVVVFYRLWRDRQPGFAAM